MDSHPVPLLARPHALRRTTLSAGAPTSGFAPSEAPPSPGRPERSRRSHVKKKLDIHPQMSLPPGHARGEGCGSMEGSQCDRLTLSAGGRGWPAAGVFTSRGGPGEGVGDTWPNLLMVGRCRGPHQSSLCVLRLWLWLRSLLQPSLRQTGVLELLIEGGEIGGFDRVPTGHQAGEVVLNLGRGRHL